MSEDRIDPQAEAAYRQETNPTDDAGVAQHRKNLQAVVSIDLGTDEEREAVKEKRKQLAAEAEAYINAELPFSDFEMELVHYAGFHYADVAPKFAEFWESAFRYVHEIRFSIQKFLDADAADLIPEWAVAYVDLHNQGMANKDMHRMFFAWLLGFAEPTKDGYGHFRAYDIIYEAQAGIAANDELADLWEPGVQLHVL